MHEQHYVFPTTGNYEVTFREGKSYSFVSLIAALVILSYHFLARTVISYKLYNL